MLVSASELINKSLDGYRRYWRHFLPYIILLIATSVVVFLAGYLGIETELRLKANRLINDIIILLIYLASLVVGIWITIGLVQTAAIAWNNQTPENWKKIFSNNNHLIAPVIINSILVTALVSLGSILFIIPGIIFFVWYNFASYAIILDNKTWKNSFSASKSLVIGRWWAIAWRIVAAIVFYSIISTILQFCFASLISYIPGLSIAAKGMASQTLGSLISLLLTPPLVTALVGLYLSARENPPAINLVK